MGNSTELKQLINVTLLNGSTEYIQLKMHHNDSWRSIRKILSDPRISAFDKATALASVSRHGYASTPGTGPVGETCQSCAHVLPYGSVVHQIGPFCDLNTTRKIELIGPFCDLNTTLTKNEGSKIELDAPACRRWKSKK